MKKLEKWDMYLSDYHISKIYAFGITRVELFNFVPTRRYYAWFKSVDDEFVGDVVNTKAEAQQYIDVLLALTGKAGQGV